MPKYPRPIPLDAALAALDTPEAVADRKVRAQKRAEKLEGLDRSKVIHSAGRGELDRALSPLLRPGDVGSVNPGRYVPLDPAREAEAEVQTGRNVDALVARQCEIQLRAEDERAIYFDPDRAEADRIWNADVQPITVKVRLLMGDEADRFVAQFRDLVAERTQAEDTDDDDALRAAERKLQRLTGTAWPVLPAAAWDTADQLPATERKAEYARLTEKYGPRDDPKAAGAGKGRRMRALSARPALDLVTATA